MSHSESPTDPNVLNVRLNLGKSTFALADEAMDSVAKAELYSLWKQGQYCDVVLRLADVCIPAHRIILAMSSPYFKAMFSSGFKENRQEDVELLGVDPEAVKLLVEYCYTRHITIESSMLEAILDAADMFLMAPVKDLCCTFLIQEMRTYNCLGIYFYADVKQLPGIRQEAQRFIQTHIHDILYENEFVTLTARQLHHILGLDHLEVSSEEFLVDAILRWVQQDPEHRMHFPELLENIRVDALTPDYLCETILLNPLIHLNPQCQVILSNKFTGHTSCKRRRLAKTEKLVLVLGGWNGELHVTAIEGLLVNQGIWVHRPPSLRMRSGSAGVVYKNLVYILGGYSGSSQWTNAVDNVDVYNPINNTWQSEGPMPTPRQCSVAVALNGHIYIIAGKTSDRIDSSNVDCFEIMARAWKVAASTPRCKGWCNAVALQGAIYALGGSDSDIAMDAAEMYNSNADLWTRVASMKQSRYRFGAAAMNDRIYVIGGSDTRITLKSVECFHPASNAWRSCASMAVARRSPGLVAHNGLLYVISGCDMTTYHKTCEVYVPVLDTWTVIQARMQVGRTDFSVVLVDASIDEPNVDDKLAINQI